MNLLKMHYMRDVKNLLKDKQGNQTEVLMEVDSLGRLRSTADRREVFAREFNGLWQLISDCSMSHSRKRRNGLCWKSLQAELRYLIWRDELAVGIFFLHKMSCMAWT